MAGCGPNPTNCFPIPICGSKLALCFPNHGLALNTGLAIPIGFGLTGTLEFIIGLFIICLIGNTGTGTGITLGAIISITFNQGK